MAFIDVVARMVPVCVVEMETTVYLPVVVQGTINPFFKLRVPGGHGDEVLVLLGGGVVV